MSFTLPQYQRPSPAELQTIEDAKIAFRTEMDEEGWKLSRYDHPENAPLSVELKTIMTEGMGRIVESILKTQDTATQQTLHARTKPNTAFDRKKPISPAMAEIFSAASGLEVEQNIRNSEQIVAYQGNQAILTRSLFGSVVRRALDTAKEMGVNYEMPDKYFGM